MYLSMGVLLVCGASCSQLERRHERGGSLFSRIRYKERFGARGGQRSLPDRDCRLQAASRGEAQSRGQTRSAFATDHLPRETRTALARPCRYPATHPWTPPSHDACPPSSTTRATTSSPI